MDHRGEGPGPRRGRDAHRRAAHGVPRARGLRLAELEQWRLALDEEGRASTATTKRIRKLERELARKEKALAEAAALLVLKKKVESLWEDEDDDTDEENEK